MSEVQTPQLVEASEAVQDVPGEELVQGLSGSLQERYQTILESYQSLLNQRQEFTTKLQNLGVQIERHRGILIFLNDLMSDSEGEQAQE